MDATRTPLQAFPTELLLQAQEISAVAHVFLFPAHTLEGGYELPVREVEAFGRVMRPQLATR